MHRFEFHNQMLDFVVRDVRPELAVLPTHEIKTEIHAVTDRLNETIGLPLDGYFSVEEFAPRLKKVMEEAVKNFDLENWKLWNPDMWQYYCLVSKSKPE